MGSNLCREDALQLLDGVFKERQGLTQLKDESSIEEILAGRTQMNCSSRRFLLRLYGGSKLPNKGNCDISTLNGILHQCIKMEKICVEERLENGCRTRFCETMNFKRSCQRPFKPHHCPQLR